MATQSYAQIQAQIAELAAQAEKLKSEEIAGVVARIKQDIATYGLSALDLFGRKSLGAHNFEVRVLEILLKCGAPIELLGHVR